MTEKIYLSNSYVKEFDGTVESASGQAVILDKTAFFPGGGGQPADTGIIASEKGAFRVVEVKKDGEEVVHILDREGLSPGMKVHATLDWETRYMHMRLHTAIHIIDGVVEKRNQGSITGGQIYDDRARVDFDIPGMDRQTVEAIISEAQKIVDSGQKVYPKTFKKEEALTIENLSRTEPGRELMKQLDEIRVIVINGFDMQMDGGTHVSSTKEVGKITLFKYENKGSHNKRIEIKLE
jgi:misacylated tRNA(Ala) deacylase